MHRHVLLLPPCHSLSPRPQCDRPRECVDTLARASARSDVDASALVDPAAPGGHGRTPLWAACHNGHLDTVRYLVEELRVSTDETWVVSHHSGTPLQVPDEHCTPQGSSSEGPLPELK